MSVCNESRVSSDPPSVKSKVEVSESVEEEREEKRGSFDGWLDGAGFAVWSRLFRESRLDAEERVCTEMVCEEEVLVGEAGALLGDACLSSMMLVGEAGLMEREVSSKQWRLCFCQV